MIKQLWQKVFKKKASAEEKSEPLLALVPIEPEPEEVLKELVAEKPVVQEKVVAVGTIVAKKVPQQRAVKVTKAVEEQPKVIDSTVDEMPIHPRFKEAQSKRKCPTCGSSLKIRSERTKTKGAAALSFYVCVDYPNCRYRYPLTNV